MPEQRLKTRKTTLLAKIWFRPSRTDFKLSIGLITVPVLTWLGVWYPVIYYDAEPEVAQSLLAGTPLPFNRAGELDRRTPKAARVETRLKEEADLLYEEMVAKYGERVGAADLYYLMLERSQDRVAVVAVVAEE